MSYISLPRLAFSGMFQADVSTVNNDVRHYDNATFLERFQKHQEPDYLNGWWNPTGTGAFRLFDVRVTRAGAAPGAADRDAAVGLWLNSQIDRSAAKIVDLDPQFQMGSMIFGLRVALTDGKREYMRGTFRPTAFRDLYFGRVRNQQVQGSEGASAKFTSVLTGVEWPEDLPDSPVVAALRDAAEANGNTLAMNLMTTLYSKENCYGTLTGSIGTWKTGEPRSFFAGRRFVPANHGNDPATAEGIGYFDADVGDALSLDLSNALPFSDRQGTFVDLGPLKLVVLAKPDFEGETPDGLPFVSPGIEQCEIVHDGDFVELGEIGYRARGWLSKTAGIVDFSIPDAVRPIISDHPLALVTPAAGSGYKVLIREAIAGYTIRAEDFELRLDSRKDDWVAGASTLYARRYGLPAGGVPITLGLAPPEKDRGGGPRHENHPPKATIYPIGVPQDGVTLQSDLRTDADGTAVASVRARDPRNPRHYIDGQIYMVIYRLAIQGASPPQELDRIVLHVRDPFEAPGMPDWDRDIAPFMTQYGNLYPVMSRHLFSLSDPGSASQHARLLSLAFSRPIEDPNHMPVTRDMSEGKRRAVLRWLGQFLPEGDGPLPTEPPAPAEGSPAKFGGSAEPPGSRS